MARLLIVDDEVSIGDALQQVFEYEGHQVRVARDGPEALAMVEEALPDVTFLDVKMPGMDGLEALDQIRSHDPQALVVMISGHGTIDTAVEATKGLADSVERLRTEVESRYEIVGSSFQIRQVLERVERVGPAEARVLITGENGTGKELVARAVHRISARSKSPFVEVNCAAIPSELIESELFGHMKGSFTGAVADRAGKFEQAHGGTLFLDEVGDMSLAAQAKVLRALEQGVVTRVGGGKAIEVDVRVVAATNKDLEAEIKEGNFREDLYYRLNVVPIEIPPLRERREDIPMLVQHFVDLLQRKDGVTPREISLGALERLQGLEWAGNVRELRNTVERLLILSSGDSIDVEDVNYLVSGGGGGGGLGGEFLQAETFADFKSQAERVFLLQKLRENDWNVSETARVIDMPRSNLYKKIERYGLVRED